MSKKSRIMTAIAACAVIILVGSGVARCTLADPAADEQAAPVESGGQEQADSDSGRDAAGDGDSPSAFDGLIGSSWASGDGLALAITSECIVASSPEGSSAIFYSVEEESVTEGSLSVTLAVSEGMNGVQSPIVLLVETGADGSQVLTCDELGGVFTREAPHETRVSIANPSDELFVAFGFSQGEFEDALSAYAQSSSPHSSRATWDGEVWIDFNAGTKLTGFSLDGAAGVAVTVVDDGSGELVCR